jgi:L-fuconolactonase
MRIDAHQHFWEYNATRDQWITEEMSVLKRDFLPADLRPELQAQKIDATVAVQVDQSEDETEFLLNLAQNHPEIAGVVGWVDLRAGNLRQRLEYFSRFEKLSGFRHIAQSEPDDQFLVREDFLRGISMLEQFDFTYDILIYPQQLPSALALVERFPNQRFVIDHLAKPVIREKQIEPWAGYMQKIARHENVFCKLSGMVTEADWRNWNPRDFQPYLDVVFESFGSDRLMFGSDWPVCLLAATYSEVTNLVAGFASSNNDKIFSQNATAFYGLRVFEPRVLQHGPAAN